MKLYKFLDGNKSCNGGDYTWSLPVKNEDGNWTPGEWTEPVEGELEACENGYHLCRPQDLIQWLNRDLFEVEADAEMIEAEDKVITRRARLLRKVETWNDRTARLFAVWCAREDLRLVENPDPRSVEAVNVAERYANGEATSEELAAARDAAWAAAGTAAGAAARAAAWAAAWAAAGAAARAAAWDAAWAAAWAAAGDAQTAKLLEMLGE